MEEDLEEQQDIEDDMWMPTPMQQVIDEMQEDVCTVFNFLRATFCGFSQDQGKLFFRLL